MYINLKNKEINIKKCDNYLSRLIGYMFKIDEINNGLYFPSCNIIHTMFMYQNIDVAFVDENNKILSLYQSVKPWNILFQKEAVSVYEFAENMLDEYSVGDKLLIKD